MCCTTLYPPFIRLTLVILTWEAEIVKVVVQGQPVQNIHETPSQPISMARHGGKYLHPI
jgi:hypothetical protein